MGQITADQSQQVMAALCTNVDWSTIDFEALGLQNSAIRDAQEAGRQLTAFLRNGCRVVIESFFRATGELTVQIPALPRPTLEQIQAKYSWIASIERDTSPTDPVTLTLGTVLRPEEKGSITGAEYERRLISKLDVALGYQHMEWLLAHQNEFPAFMALLGKIYIDFPGLVVVDDDGSRYVPYCDQGGRRWDAIWGWLGIDFSVFGRVAVSGK